MNKKKGAEAPNQFNNSNSISAQHKRLIEALREGGKSTIWIRKELDILMPAARVHELRHRDGHNIQTYRRYVHTEVGKAHSVAEYVLMPGKWQGGII